MVTVEGRGDVHFLGRRASPGIFHQVAGQLPLDKSVVGLVLVEGFNDPVAVGRHIAQPVHRVAVRIGEAGQVEPVGGHALAVMRRFEQPIHEFLVGVRTLVLFESVDFGQRGRQSGDVEGDTADERFLVGFLVWGHSFLLQAMSHEVVDRIFNPIGVIYRWDSRHNGFLKSPMRLVFSALVYPFNKHCFFVSRQAQVRFRRGHQYLRISGNDATEDLTIAQTAGVDSHLAGRLGQFVVGIDG